MMIEDCIKMETLINIAIIESLKEANLKDNYDYAVGCLMACEKINKAMEIFKKEMQE